MKEIKITLLFQCLLAFTNFVNAQITITGKVVDVQNQPIEFANVVLLKDENNEIVAGTITDEKGNFVIKTDKDGEFNLQISFVGFENYTMAISSTIDIGNIILISNNELDEVVVIARKSIIERKSDKLIFNVENSPVKSGFDGIEVLKRTPSIIIDGRDNILIQNKSATVLINGRKLNMSGEELANYLKSIDASNIKKIEIQTNASSEMDANVQGGVINLILKKKQIGLFAQFKAYQMQKGKHPNFYSSGNINYGTQKWNLYSTIVFNDAEDSGMVKSGTVYNQIERQIQENGDFLENSKRYTFIIGTTYQPSEKHDMGFELYASSSDNSNKSNSAISILDDGMLLDIGNTTTPRDKNVKYMNASINYSIKLDTLGGKIIFISDYAIQKFNSGFDATTTYQEAFYDDIIERSKTKSFTDILSAQIDFNKTIRKIGDFSTGIKFSTTNRENTTVGENFINGSYQVALERTNAFDFTENIYASYFSLSRTILKGFNLKLGLRVENTQIKGINVLTNTPVSQDYTNYFPSFFISKELKSDQSISFNYNSRISRPAFSILNPYVIKINDFSYQIGNPDLKPQYISNFEFAYNLKQHSLSLYYNQVSNLISGIYFPVNEAIYYQSQNIGKSKIVGLDYNFSKNIKKWWYFKVGTTLQNQIYILPGITNNYNTFSIYVNNDWNISNSWSVNLSAYYSSPRIYGYLEVADYFIANFMVQKSFLKEKLKVRFYVGDLFNTARDKNSGFYDDFVYNFYQKRNTQSFTLWVLFTMDSRNKITNKRTKSSNTNKGRL